MRCLDVWRSPLTLGALTTVLVVLLAGGCSRLSTTPAPPDVRTVMVLPVDNRTGSTLEAEAPPLLGLLGREPSTPAITAADLLTQALRTSLRERGFATSAGPPPGTSGIGSPEEAARLVAASSPDAAALYTRLRVWEAASRSHLVYVDVALDAWLVAPDGRALWTAHLPATPIDGGGASSVSLGYPEVARRVADLVTSGLRPADPRR